MYTYTPGYSLPGPHDIKYPKIIFYVSVLTAIDRLTQTNKILMAIGVTLFSGAFAGYCVLMIVLATKSIKGTKGMHILYIHS